MRNREGGESKGDYSGGFLAMEFGEGEEENGVGGGRGTEECAFLSWI